MKTPEEIKKGLECCQGRLECECCPYQTECDLPFGDIVEADALAYIQQLESRLAQVERERDAAIVDIQNAKWCLCHVCQNYYRPDPDVRHYECKVFGKFSDLFSPSDFEEEENNPISMCGKFKWRGVCPENTKDGADE